MKYAAALFLPILIFCAQQGIAQQLIQPQTRQPTDTITKPFLELTESYQFSRYAGTNVPDGAETNVNAPINKWLGITLDLRAAYYKGETVVGYGAGPQFTLRTRNVEPYARVIIGGSYISEVNFWFYTTSAAAFYVSPGVGADFRLSDRVWLRGGADCAIIPYVHLATPQFSVGITFKPGRSHNRTAFNSTFAAQTAPTAMAAPSLGIVVDSQMHIISFFPESVLINRGLQTDDIINMIDDKPVTTPAELVNATSTLTKGMKVKVGYLSHGRWQTWISVQL